MDFSGDLVWFMCIINGEQLMHELCTYNVDKCTEVNLYACFLFSLNILLFL